MRKYQEFTTDELTDENCKYWLRMAEFCNWELVGFTWRFRAAMRDKDGNYIEISESIRDLIEQFMEEKGKL